MGLRFYRKPIFILLWNVFSGLILQKQTSCHEVQMLIRQFALRPSLARQAAFLF